MRASGHIATLGLAWALTSLGSTALGETPSNDPEAIRVIEARLRTTRPFSKRVAIEEGDTALIKKVLRVDSAKLRSPETEYEGLVTGIVSPPGVVVHPRMEMFRFVPRGAKTDVVATFAIHIDPSTRSGGQVRFNLTIVERKGLANVLAKERVTLSVTIADPGPTQRDLRADFEGYRRCGSEAQALRKALAKQGLRLSLRDNARMPPLSRAKSRTVRKASLYESARRCMWTAHRHLVTATKSRQPAIAAAARAYLSNLDKPRSQWRGLPAVSLTSDAVSPPPPPPPPPARSDGSEETLAPIASNPVSSSAGRGGGDVLAPVSSYDPNVDESATQSLPPSRAPRPEPAPPVEEAPAPVPVPTPGTAATPPAEDPEYEDSDDPFEQRAVRKYKTIPSYTRGLLLDDPNISNSGAFRMAFANVQLREPARTAAFFFEGQFAFTRAFGVELTIPMEYVNVSLNADADADASSGSQSSSITGMGNPLLAGKYRIHLPTLLGRKPVLTFRARAALPIVPLHSLPLITSLDAEDFTRDAYFADTYAFFLEKADVGAGASFAWRWKVLRLGAQAYLDYFIPISGAKDDLDFLALSWGASVGAEPFGETVGFFAEARGVSLFSGIQRNEVFAYVGARGRFLDHFEPALWVGFPLGSVQNSSPWQVGGELRVAFDVLDVIDPGTGTERDAVQLLE